MSLHSTHDRSQDMRTKRITQPPLHFISFHIVSIPLGNAPMASNEKEGRIIGATDAETEATEQENEEEGDKSLSTTRIVLVLLSLYGISAASSLGTGLVTIGIPQIAQELSLRDGLLLW